MTSEKRWDEMRTAEIWDQVRWGEKRWNEVCEVREVWSETWSCAGHVLGQQQCNQFAPSTHARAWVAHGARKVWKRSRTITLRQLPPHLVRVLPRYYTVLYEFIWYHIILIYYIISYMVLFVASFFRAAFWSKNVEILGKILPPRPPFRPSRKRSAPRPCVRLASPSRWGPGCLRNPKADPGDPVTRVAEKHHVTGNDCYIANWFINDLCWMDKSTLSMVIFRYVTNYQRVLQLVKWGWFSHGITIDNLLQLRASS